MTIQITAEDERNLRRSWGDEWRLHTAGKEEAVRSANELLAKMKGHGWKIGVSENLGWYYDVHTKYLRVSPSARKGYYSCLMGENGTGNGCWTTLFHSEDPNEAVKHEIERAAAHIKECTAMLNQARSILPLKSFYIGHHKECDCIVAACVDTPGREKQTAMDVAEFIEQGLVVEHIMAESVTIGDKCPHKH